MKIVLNGISLISYDQIVVLLLLSVLSIQAFLILIHDTVVMSSCLKVTNRMMCANVLILREGLIKSGNTLKKHINLLMMINATY